MITTSANRTRDRAGGPDDGPKIPERVPGRTLVVLAVFVTRAGLP
ncbi:SCO1431 family membrane protein [Streptomyces sp. HB132]|nr:SCO1431 family membrane protein [Streptomyces sp. HB132]MBM7440984.1 hypothetical protein [Streptomyces sp. HB132]